VVVRTLNRCDRRGGMGLGHGRLPADNPCDSRGRMGVGRGRVWPVDRCGPNHAWHTDTGGFVTSASQKHSPGVALSGVPPFHVFRPCELGPGPARLVLRALPVHASNSARLTALRMAAISPACSMGGWPSQVIAAKRVEALRFWRNKRIVFRRRPVVRAGGGRAGLKQD
jgi:hypothetical protein